MGFLWSSVAFPLPNLVELPFYGFVGEEIERYGYQGIAPCSQGTHYSASAHLQMLWQPVSSILFPSLSWCSLGCFVFSPCLSSHPSSSLCKPLSLSLSLLLSQHECPTLWPYVGHKVFMLFCFQAWHHQLVESGYTKIDILSLIASWWWACLHKVFKLHWLSRLQPNCSFVGFLEKPAFFCLGSLWLPWSWCLFDMRSWCIGSCSG